MFLSLKIFVADLKADHHEIEITDEDQDLVVETGDLVLEIGKIDQEVEIEETAVGTEEIVLEIGLKEIKKIEERKKKTKMMNLEN